MEQTRITSDFLCPIQKAEARPLLDGSFIQPKREPVRANIGIRSGGVEEDQRGDLGRILLLKFPDMQAAQRMAEQNERPPLVCYREQSM